MKLDEFERKIVNKKLDKNRQKTGLKKIRPKLFYLEN